MASSDSELRDFVAQSIHHGVARDDVERALLDAGWAREQVRAALATYAEVDFPVPVPRPRPYVSARDAFVYLALFLALGLSAYQLGALVFGIIDIAFPDPLETHRPRLLTSRTIR